MPPKVGRGSRSALIVKNALQVEDPFLELQSLLLFTPRSSASVTMDALPSSNAKLQLPGMASVTSLNDCGSSVSDQESKVAGHEVAKPGKTADNSSIRMQHFKAASRLPVALMLWAFDLIKGSLQSLYEPVWGWSDAKKKTQLEAASSRFIFAMMDDGAGEKPAAFINYRLEPYDNKPVCYLYEVMVATPFQRMGLGTHLMHTVEQMAWGLGMDRCVLTEFKANKAAEAFYRKLGYRPDATTPSATSCGYIILSKPRPASKAS